MKHEVCVIIPTYNEVATIGGLIRSVQGCGYNRILVVDDGTDGTSVIATSAGARVRKGKGIGLGDAIRTGMLDVVENGYAYAVVIDAGGTHDPAHISKLVEEVRSGGHCLAIASRFVGDYASQGWRTKLSLMASRLLGLLFGIHVKDVTSGYRCYDLSVYNKSLLSDSQAWGHAVQMELLLLGLSSNKTQCEISTPYLPLTKSTLSVRSLLDAGVVLYRMFVIIKLF